MAELALLLNFCSSVEPSTDRPLPSLLFAAPIAGAQASRLPITVHSAAGCAPVWYSRSSGR